MKDKEGHEAIYYGTSKEDAKNYGDKHAKPYGYKYHVTKEGTPNRPYILWVLIENIQKRMRKKDK